MNKSSLLEMNILLKEKVLRLRKDCWSYGKISKSLNISKATVAYWSRHPEGPCGYMSTPARIISRKKGWATCRRKRVEKVELLKKESLREIKKLKYDKNYLWIVGTMLYWAEGAKEKEYKYGQSVYFSNSDPLMIKTFIYWLLIIIKAKLEDITLDIYVHDNHKHRIATIKRYWMNNTGLSESKFDRIYFKKHNVRCHRRNTKNKYFGLVRVRLKKSTDIQRKIMFWVQGFCDLCGVV